MIISKLIRLCLIFSLFAAVSLQAEFIITAEISGNDVVLEGSGSLDLTGLTASGGPYDSSPRGFYPTNSVVRVGSTTTGSILLYTGFTSSPSSLGTGGFTAASSGTGLLMAVNASFLRVDASYTSGDPIVTSNVYENVDFAGLGLVPGVYTWEWSADSFTLKVIDGNSPQTWGGYTLEENGTVDTADWLGVLYVEDAPYVWSFDLNQWLYIDENTDSEDGNWIFILKD